MAPTVDLRRPGWKKTSSPRHLVFRHGRQQLGKLRRADEPITEAGTLGLLPGQERLFSSYVPGLGAGLHRIGVTQDIKAGGQSMQQTTSHLFNNVIGPRFALPEGALNSLYPPPGHADGANVLPHMVFNDPTLPWERPASSPGASGNEITSVVPWLAVLLFTQDELRLGSDELCTMFADTSLGTKVEQSQTLAVKMLASEVAKVKDTSSAVVYDAEVDGADATTDVIFVPCDLFNSLFALYDIHGMVVQEQTTCYVRPYQFLAHVRHIHLDGTPTAATTDDETHAYSVVVCRRTGPLDITHPTTVVAHLVSIEGVAAMGWPVTQGHVAMSSLYSWDYTCMPPGSVRVENVFGQLGKRISSLGPPLTRDEIDRLQHRAGDAGSRLASRLQDGFSLVRYRLQTGEVSSAFFRGPCTPAVVSFPNSEPPPWPGTSTTGAQLQILDPEYNLMDLTYSAAWNLGKTLALADQSFTIALSRVRGQILDAALQEAQLAAAKTWAADLGIPCPYVTKEEVLSSIAATIDKVSKLPQSGSLERDPDGMVRRWFRPELPRLDLSYHGDDVGGVDIGEFLDRAAAVVASTTDVQPDGKVSAGQGPGPSAPYNEFNTPSSTDWAVVLRWVMDRYFLVNVPPHYMVSDPSHLPRESVRFFNVDPAWVSAMVDGGLSLANHVDRSDDRVRDAIKKAINTYLTTPIPGLGYVPPVPTYGFLARSALITKFPDMVVDTKTKDQADAGKTGGPPEVLRHQVLGQDTLLGLLRTAPAEGSDFTSLFLREPPHQQYYWAATEITPQTIEMQYRRVYTDPAAEAEDPDIQTPIPYNVTRSDSASYDRGANFIWGTTASATDVRILNMENYAWDVQRQLIQSFSAHPTWYTEKYPTAALMGIQMNAPSRQLEVQLPYQSPPAAAASASASAVSAPAAAAQSSPSFSTEFPCKQLHSRAAAVPVLSVPNKRQPGPPRSKAAFPARPRIACAPHPPFGQRHRAAAALRSVDPAPHVRALQKKTSSQMTAAAAATTTTTTRSKSEDAKLPSFTYLVYPVSGAAARQSRVPALPDQTRQDLVFSILLLPNDDDPGWQLGSLTFSVPLSPANGYPLLEADRNGSYLGAGGVRMLANERFNVVAEVVATAAAAAAADGTAQALVLTVVPRSSTGRWPASAGAVGNGGDMSFLLSGVVVAREGQGGAGGTRPVEVGVTEAYAVPDTEVHGAVLLEVYEGT